MARRTRRGSATAHARIISSTVSSVVSSVVPSRATSPGPAARSFRFFDLPSELRLKIYESLLHMKQPLDLDSSNYRTIHPRLAVFLVSRRMHDEAYRVFYAQAMRLFPKEGRFYHTKRPLLARLPIHYRRAVHTMELLLGRGWTAPPRCQNTHPSLGLSDCSGLRRLKIFVEIDPSDSMFTGFRGKNATEETYKCFCIDLLRGIIEQVPRLEEVEIDANPGVKRDGPLIMALRRIVDDSRIRLVWSALREWDKAEEPALIGLESAMAGMSISGVPGRLITAQA